VYGVLPEGKASEDTPTQPINPYGTSKLMTEWMLRDLAFAGGPSYVALRYFNVAGCEPSGTIGQSTPKATLLVKVACEAAVGKRPHVSVFGSDYPTPDGTGLRDYIHVEDLASAHLDALIEKLKREVHGSGKLIGLYADQRDQTIPARFLHQSGQTSYPDTGIGLVVRRERDLNIVTKDFPLGAIQGEAVDRCHGV